MAQAHNTEFKDLQAASFGFEEFPAATENLDIQVFQDQIIGIHLVCHKPDPNNPQNTNIVVEIVNKGQGPISGVHLDAAVPNHLQLKVSTPNQEKIKCDGEDKARINLKIENSMQGEKPIQLKLKVNLCFNIFDIQKDLVVTEFPSNY